MNNVTELTPECIATLLLTLTVREQQVLRYLIKGCGNYEIAPILGIAAATVKIHRSNVYKKLGVTTLQQLMNLLNVKSNYQLI